MALTIKKKAASSAPLGVGHVVSNKPPEPLGADSFKDSLTFEDGKTVWLSNPKPDRISIVGHLVPENFPAPFGDGGGLAARVMDLANGLKGAVEPGLGGAFTSETGSRVGKFALACGKRQAKVHVEISRRKEKASGDFFYPMRLDFNPRKLGPEGIAELKYIFTQAPSHPFDFAGFVAHAGVTRLDIAVDFVGICPAEMLVTAKIEGKRIAYMGQAGGELETLQVHGKKTAPKTPKAKLSSPAGPLRIKVYDRNAERAARGKPPVVDGYAVTRAETVQRRFPPGFGMDQIGSIMPFKGVTASYAPACSPWADSSRWQLYLAVRAARGHKMASKLMSLSQHEREAARKAAEKHPNNLLGGLVAADWGAGLQETGLEALLIP
jgi:hypothetical protein